MLHDTDPALSHRDSSRHIRPARQPLYFASGERRLFGWYHAAAAERAKNCVVVICNPLGYEYTHSHRSLRHLAESLAESGIAALRFDYDGTGDSPGDDLAPHRVECWLQDIRAAVATARTLSGCSDVCLLGVRMGATLAAIVASTDDIAHLILWSPCNGRHYVREMKALALAAASETENTLGFESAGFMILHETAEQIKNIKLNALPYRRECGVLLLERDDIDGDPALAEYLRERGVDVTRTAVAGYAEMMAEPQFTEIPAQAIHCIAHWLTNRTTPLAQSTVNDNLALLSETALTQEGGELIERCHQFGREDILFGIVSQPQHRPSNDNKPAIVLFNSGSVHRVGPNRLYVTLARKLAARGFLCFRFDLQGLGDSFLRQGRRENHPYPSSAIADAESALQFLRATYGCSSFIVTGLCSGAHAAFHTGINVLNCSIDEVILINPLTYRYVEGMSLVTTSHHQDVAYYKGSARQLRSWLKLLSGKVDIINLVKLGMAQISVVIKSFSEYLREKFFDRATTQLSADLRTLLAHDRQLSLFVATSDPGYSLLLSGARYMTKKGIASGRIRYQFIPEADHTFSRFTPRQDFIQRFCAHLESRYKTADIPRQ